MSEQDVADLERETRSSITLKRSAKLEPYWEAKAYYEGTNADEAMDRLQHIDTEMKRRFLP